MVEFELTHSDSDSPSDSPDFYNEPITVAAIQLAHQILAQSVLYVFEKSPRSDKTSVTLQFGLIKTYATIQHVSK